MLLFLGYAESSRTSTRSLLSTVREKECLKKLLCDEEEKAPPVDPEFREVERVLAPGRAVLAHHLEEGLPEKTRAKRNCGILRGGIPFPCRLTC